MFVRKVAIISPDSGASEDWNINYCGMVLISGDKDEVDMVVGTEDYNDRLQNVPVSIDSKDPEVDAIEVLRLRFPNVEFEYLGLAGAVILDFEEE